MLYITKLFKMRQDTIAMRMFCEQFSTDSKEIGQMIESMSTTVTKEAGHRVGIEASNYRHK